MNRKFSGHFSCNFSAFCNTSQCTAALLDNNSFNRLFTLTDLICYHLWLNPFTAKADNKHGTYIGIFAKSNQSIYSLKIICLYDAMIAKIGSVDALQLFNFVPFQELLLPMVATFAAAGMFVGIVGSWTSIRKFMDV